MTSPDAAVTRLPEVDWLRGLAALGVFFFHAAAVADLPKRTLPPIDLFGLHIDGLPSIFGLGSTGVHLFFVLSGFCLALQRWRVGGGFDRARLATYARHRLARIVPAYWAACLLSAAVVLALGQPALAVATTVVVHAFFLHGLLREHFLALNGALWSMATEVEFYLAFPLLWAAYRRGRPWPFVTATLALTLVGRAAIVAAADESTVGDISTRAFLLNQLPGRLFEFCAGIALADVYLRGYRSPRVAWPLVGLIPLALWARALGPPALVDPLVGLAYAGLVAALLLRPPADRPSPRLARLERWAAAFGRSSYSFFLVHAPILLAVKAALPLAAAGPWERLAVYASVALALSLLVGSTLYLTVERPLWRRLSRPSAAA